MKTRDQADLGRIFGLLTEIGIISQLSGRLLEEHLPDGYLISHFSVLNHLVRLGDGQTPMALATAFQLPKTTMTHTLAGLEKAGLIRFVPNPDDGRSKCVELTKAGRSFREDAITNVAPDVLELSAAIGADGIDKALPLLARIRAHLDNKRN